VFRQLSKGEVKEIADIMLREVFKRAEVKGITIDVTERFKARRPALAPSNLSPACSLSSLVCPPKRRLWHGSMHGCSGQ
jgi:hypothetical protein